MVDIRLWFEKRGDARYISHLDLSRSMQRALKRSGLPVWYTEGFNPHVYVTFALPLSLGQETECDVMDFRLSQEVPMKQVEEAMARIMPPDLKVVRCAAPIQKTKEIASAVYEIRLEGASEELDWVSSFLKRDSVLVMKRTKKGGQKQVDLAPHLADSTCRVQDGDLVITLTLPAGSENTVNPSLVLSAMEEEGKCFGLYRVLRTAILNKQGEPFC